jgi:hypothetical protein
MSDWIRKVIEQNFQLLVLMLLIGIMVSLIIWAVVTARGPADGANISWMREQTAALIGALLGWLSPRPGAAVPLPSLTKDPAKDLIK